MLLKNSIEIFKTIPSIEIKRLDFPKHNVLKRLEEFCKTLIKLNISKRKIINLRLNFIACFIVE